MLTYENLLLILDSVSQRPEADRAVDLLTRCWHKGKNLSDLTSVSVLTARVTVPSARLSPGTSRMSYTLRQHTNGHANVITM